MRMALFIDQDAKYIHATLFVLSSPVHSWKGTITLGFLAVRKKAVHHISAYM